MLVISKIGYQGERLMETSICFKTENIKNIDKYTAKLMLENMEKILVCDNPIYVCWEKHWLDKQLSVDKILELLK